MSRACLPGSLRLQGSLALLALSFSTELHGLVSCRARSWGSPFEAFPFAEEDQRLSTRSDPHAVGSSGVRLLSASLARLLGVSRSGSPLLARRGFPSRRPLLPWVSPPQGLSSPVRHAPASWAFLSRAWLGHLPPGRLLRVSIAPRPGVLRRDRRPSRGFCTSFGFRVVRGFAVLAYRFASGAGGIAAPGVPIRTVDNPSKSPPGPMSVPRFALATCTWNIK